MSTLADFGATARDRGLATTVKTMMAHQSPEGAFQTAVNIPRAFGGTDMVETITAQADDTGRYTAGSMYRAWKGWSFADKKQPSPWLTCLVLRLEKRIGAVA